MLTFDSKQQQTVKPVEYPWVLLLLAFVWLWPGVIHRDLWNLESALYSSILHIQQTNNLFISSHYGETYIPNMPVYLWIATAFQRLSALFPMSGYTAARLSTSLLTVLSLWAMGGAGRELLGKYNGRSVVLILIGCPGVLVIGHSLDSTIMLFSAFCSFIYGVALSRRKTVFGGLLIGVSWLLAFWSGNVPPLLFLWLITALLPFANEWRTRRYLRAITLALLIALPLLPVLPLLLKHHNPTAFQVWFNHHILGIFGGMSQHNIGFSPLKLLKDLLWFAAPAWLIALWAIYRRKILTNTTGWFCLTWLITASFILIFQKDIDNRQLIWLLPPLAIIGAASLDDIKRGVAAFFNWFGVMIFGFCALFLWAMFFAINYGVPYRLSEWASRFNPYFSPDWNYFPMILALSFTPIWLWAVTRRHIRGRKAITNWAAGMTLIWTILLSLFLPWIESLKSYRPIAQDIQHNAPDFLINDLTQGKACLDSDNIALLTALDEYVGVSQLFYTPTPNAQCHYRITASEQGVLDIPQNAQILWHGTRGKRGRDIIVLFVNPNAINE
ncbi:MAG: glycosyltransferase family 39 protein [Neisseriaceae bacterium]|nr:glycosyltransferase family 39 protein [Neisseriaceae bacterium]